MCVNLVAGAEADTRNACLTHPVRAVCREIPLARFSSPAIERSQRLLPGLHKRMIVGQRPRREYLVEREDKAGIAWFVILQQFHLYVGTFAYDLPHLLKHAVGSLAKSHPAINEDSCFIW